MLTTILNAADRETLLKSEVAELALEDAMTGNFVGFESFRKTILGGYYSLLGDTSLLSLYGIYESTYWASVEKSLTSTPWEPDPGFALN